MDSLDNRLVSWFNRYQEYLQIEANRRRILDRTDGDCGRILELGRSRCPDRIQRGTLVSFAEQGLGHYMAFAKISADMPTVLIFDPSGIDGQYAYPGGRRPFIQVLRVNFPGFKFEFWDEKIDRYHSPPQNSKYDSFCQTWSLAWLDPVLQGIISNVVLSGSETSRQRALHTIIEYILSLPGTPPGLSEAWHQEVTFFFNRFWVNDGARARLNRVLFY